MSTQQLPRPPAVETGCVAHLSAGGWGHYHRPDCALAPRRGAAGVRHVVHGPWRYLAAHWTPCPVCRPPGESALSTAA